MAERPDTKAILVRVAAELQRVRRIKVASEGVRLAAVVERGGRVNLAAV